MTESAIRLRALGYAVHEIGVKEQPAGSNWGPRVKQYLASVHISSPAPWCLAFVHWCYDRAEYPLAGGGLVQSLINWAAANKGTFVSRPFKGDIVCYDWNADNWYDHVGIVEKVLALRWTKGTFIGWVQTVEGNTAVGNDSNGGCVMRRRRWIQSARFIRI